MKGRDGQRVGSMDNILVSRMYASFGPFWDIWSSIR
jgi:hypothetical protein